MKFNHYILIVLVAAVVLLSANLSTQEALTIAHINSAELLEQMPEVDSVNTILQKIEQENTKHLETMGREYEAKLQELQNIDPNTPQSVQEMKYQEVIDLQNRIRKFQTQAQQDLEQKRVQMVEPILDKAQRAIDEVADELHYDYVFDTSYGTVLHSAEGDNILEQVKKKLKLS